MTKTPPGYHERKRIAEELPRLSRRRRAAFAAGCAERVLPIVQNYFGQSEVGDRALRLTWRYALGETVDGADVDAVIKEGEDRVGDLYEAEETGATLRALNAVIFALESTRKLECGVAQRAASEAQGAAGSDTGKSGDLYIQEEADWQMAALEMTIATEAPTRDMFKRIAVEPNWLRLYRQTQWIRR